MKLASKGVGLEVYPLQHCGEEVFQGFPIACLKFIRQGGWHPVDIRLCQRSCGGTLTLVFL